MAKVKYTIKENTKVGTHSFYAVPVVNGSLDFLEVCEEACENTSIEPSLMRAAVTEYMKAVKRNVLKGFRCAVGEQFLLAMSFRYCFSMRERSSLSLVLTINLIIASMRAQITLNTNTNFITQNA